MYEVLEYVDEHGQSPFAKWFNKLKAPAALKVTTALTRVNNGNLGDTSPVGQGVNELRLHFQKGYRIYYGRDGDTLIILLGGSTKQRQADAIKLAQERWKLYKSQNRKEP